MRHVSKAKLSLAVALTIAGAIIPNAMAMDDDGVIRADNFYVMNLGEVPGVTKGIEADHRAIIVMDRVHARATDDRPAIIVAKNDGSITVREGLIQVGNVSGPAVISNGGVVNLGVDGSHGKMQGYDINLDGDVRIDGNEETSSIINIGLDQKDALWVGFALNLADKNSPHDNHINVFLGEQGYWDHFYQGGLSGTSYSTMTTPSHVHRLVGAKNRNFNNGVTQSEHNEIHIDKLEGHVNFIYDPNEEYADTEDPEYTPPTTTYNGLTADSFWGGDIHITSAAPNAGAHLYTSRKGLDLSTEDNVNKVLDNLAHKVYYHNYVTGERNLEGTVGIASEGAESGRFKVLTSGYAKEGAITWQADQNGQGKYVYGNTTVTPALEPSAPEPPAQEPPAQETPVQEPPAPTSDYDTPHMRGARSAIMSNINGWRTLTNTYRPRALQQGATTGIWAHIGGGQYSYDAQGIDTDTTYTRIQGGYDAKTSSGWTVGGQVSYLRGHDDYVSNGSGKEKAFAVGAYGLKDLGRDQYIQLESQVGRVTNTFTTRNEIGESLSGETKANAYTIGARYGKTVKLQNGVYIEPQAQLSYTRFGGDSFNAGTMHVDQAGVSSTAGGLGLEIGKTFGAGSIYTRVGVNHAFSGSVKTTYISGSTVKSTEQDLKGTWTDLAFGGRYGINANNSLYADISTGLSGDYKAGWSVNAGFTHKF